MIRTSITHRNSSIYFNHGLFDKRFRDTLVSFEFCFCSRCRRPFRANVERTASHVSACLTGCLAYSSINFFEIFSYSSEMSEHLSIAFFVTHNDFSDFEV